MTIGTYFIFGIYVVLYVFVWFKVYRINKSISELKHERRQQEQLIEKMEKELTKSQ